MRNSTENIYRQKINQVIDYISANLHTPLPIGTLAAQINVSERQLLRIMRSALDEPLATYVARQRIERAVLYMQTEEMNLANLAVSVGYDNPQSFSKAFKKQFGIPPKTYKDKLRERLKEQIQNSKNTYNEIQPEICKEAALDLIYIRILGQYGDKRLYETAWNKLIGFLKSRQILSASTRFIGISFDDPNVTVPGLCRFYACASIPKPETPTGEFGTIRLREGKYAVYTLKGSYSGLQDLYNCINLNFSDKLCFGLAYEEYLTNPRNATGEELLTKIHIPIK